MEVFVYGTLTDRTQVARVLSEFEFRGEATLEGLHRVDGRYPTLAPGGSVSGRVLWTPEMEQLDAYEGVEQELYVRVSVPKIEDGKETDTVAVYVGDPATLGADASWPGEESFPEAVQQFVREAEVLVRPTERG